MEQETTTASAPAADVNSQPEPTLEDVYKSAAADFQPAAPAAPAAPAQPAAAPSAPAAPYVPDPYDTEAHKAYLAQLAKGQTDTQEALRQVAGYLTQQQQEKARAVLDADIKSAVDTVNEVVGHPKPKVIEAMLDAKAREDVRFKALFDNRAKNPAAWNNALKAVSREFATDLSVKVDPALQASQRARKIAQSQMATTEGPKSDAEEWESMSPADQQAKMNRMLHDGMSG